MEAALLDEARKRVVEHVLREAGRPLTTDEIVEHVNALPLSTKCAVIEGMFEPELVA